MASAEKPSAERGESASHAYGLGPVDQRDDLFPRSIRPLVFGVLWSVLVLLLVGLALVIRAYLEASGR
jgi:hypothetical protein